jgi:hypothetical protein
MAVTMTREETEQKMNESAREFAPAEIYRIARQLKELDH